MSTAAKEGLVLIAESIARGKGNFDVAAVSGTSCPFMLSAGAPKTVRVPGGFIVSLGISREQLRELHAMCARLLELS